MCPIYTKTFGGKIWQNLHSVSPDNILNKIFKMASLTISRQNYFNVVSCKKFSKLNVKFPSTIKKEEKFSAQILWK